MRNLLISFVVILSFIGIVFGFSAYKWVPLKSGDKIPDNCVTIARNGHNSERYVGRARHFDEILPAEIYANGTAYVYSCGKKFQKYQFEILTTSSVCKWMDFDSFEKIDETAVRIGTAWDNEPIYLGKYHQYYNNYNDYENDVFSIYLKTAKVKDSFGKEKQLNNLHRPKYLSCPTNVIWVDTLAANVTNNTVSGGKSEDGYEIYVARLRRKCDIVVGQAVPELGFAQAFLNYGEKIDADYCQVLTGDENEYKWIPASDGVIPDYAVAESYKINYELSYIARFNDTIGHLTHSEALEQRMDYEILVMNYLEFKTIVKPLIIITKK